MGRYSYAYPLGVVSCLEKRLAPSKVFFDILSYNLERLLSEIKPYFFQGLTFYQSIEEFEVFLEREEKVLNILIREWIKEALFKSFLDFFKYQPVKETQLKSFPYLLNLFKLRIDLYNIIFSLRAGYLNKNFSPHFFGFLSKEEIKDLLNEDKTLKVRKPEYFPFFYSARSFLKDDVYFLLDFLPFGFLRKRLEGAKKIILGPERIFYFYFLKRLQDKIMKVIVSSKLYNLEEERVKKILEVVYG